jgi:hypothetical protein
MPRNGSGIFSAAEPAVVTQTTIESAVFNNVIQDIVTDLNAARPISAGGTGAATAGGARTALDVAQRQPAGSTADATADLGLVVGSFGLGGNAVSKADFSDLVSTTTFMRTAATSTPNAPTTADTWSGLNVKKTTTTGWQFMGDFTGQKVMARFQSAVSTFSDWMHVRLLVSTTTNANGTSKRYSDGTQECFLKIAGLAAETASGNIFVSGLATWTFPQAFADAAVIEFSGAVDNALSWVATNAPSTTDIVYRRVSTATSSSTPDIRLSAKGTWT